MDYGDKLTDAKWSLLTPPQRSLFAPPLTQPILHNQVLFGRTLKSQQADMAGTGSGRRHSGPASVLADSQLSYGRFWVMADQAAAL